MDKVPDYDASQRIVDPNQLGSSSVLRSSSKYLNDPRLRDWVSTESLRRNGRDYNHYGGVLELLDIFRDLTPTDEINALFAIAKSKNAELANWFDERYLYHHDLDQLRPLPPGTLGREYANMLDEQNLTPDFLPDEGTASDWDYYKRRAQQTHDIEHVVTSFRYDPVGEFGLIAIKGINLLVNLGPELSQHLNAYSQFLLVTGLSRMSLHYPHILPSIYRAIGQGERIGREMKPIFLPKYEEMFDWPLEEVRSALNVVVPEDKEDTMWTLVDYYDPE